MVWYAQSNKNGNVTSFLLTVASLLETCDPLHT